MNSLPRISTRKFKKLLKQKVDVKDKFVLCRSEDFSYEQSDDDNLIRTFTISTASEDREGDKIFPNWKLDNFQKGGSVLWGHDHSSTPEHVIANPLATWQEGDALKSRAQFTPREVNPMGYLVWKLIQFGALKSASVGFLPLEFEESEERVNPRGWAGIDFKFTELLEWSVVPVPANPEALVEAKSKGLDMGPMESWLEEVLDEQKDLVVVGRDILQANWQALKKPKTISIPKIEPKIEPEKTELEMNIENLKTLVDTAKKSTEELNATFLKTLEDMTKAVAETLELYKSAGIPCSDEIKAMAKSLCDSLSTLFAETPEEGKEIDLDDPTIKEEMKEFLSEQVEKALAKSLGSADA